MASSKVMVSSSSSLQNNSSFSSLLTTTTSIGSVGVNMYSEPDSLRDPSIDGAPIGLEVEPRMTLEDFLTKAGATNVDDDILVTPPLPVDVDHGSSMMSVHFPVTAGGVFGRIVSNTAAAASIRGNRGGGGGRGKKRRGGQMEEIVIDKATQQKQKRMIKNRESAARSRDRKQAYTVELESLVTQLEKENARLLLQEDEKNKERFKQLMETLIPVVDKRRQPRPLRRVQSMSW